MPASLKLSSYLVAIIVAWMVVMTWRIYPQFKDAVRVDGRLTTVGDYIDDACGERVGPAAETCFAEAHETAQRLLRREQGKSVLLIEAPLFAYLLFYVPIALWRGRRKTLVMAAIATTLLVPAVPPLARADMAQQQNFAAWRQMAECAHLAALKYPDHTPEGNARREAMREECLRIHHLPVTTTPPPTQATQ